MHPNVSPRKKTFSRDPAPVLTPATPSPLSSPGSPSSVSPPAMLRRASSLPEEPPAKKRKMTYEELEKLLETSDEKVKKYKGLTEDFATCNKKYELYNANADKRKKELDKQLETQKNLYAELEASHLVKVAGIFEQAKKEKSERDDRIKDLEDQLNMKRDRIEELRRLNTELNDKTNNQRKSLGTLHTVQEGSKKLLAEITTLQTDLKNVYEGRQLLVQKTESLQKQNDEAWAEKQALEEKLKEAKKSQWEYHGRNKKLARSLEILEKDLSHTKEERENEKKEMASKYDTLAKEKDKLRLEHEREKKEMTSKYDRLLKETNNLKKEREKERRDLSSKNDTLAKEMGSLKEEIDHLKWLADRQQEERTGLKSKSETLVNANDELKSKAENHEKIVKGLKETIEKRDQYIEALLQFNPDAAEQIMLKQKSESLQSLVSYMWELTNCCLEVLKQIGMSPSKLSLRQEVRKVTTAVQMAIEAKFLTADVTVEQFNAAMPDNNFDVTRDNIRQFISNFLVEKKKVEEKKKGKERHSSGGSDAGYGSGLSIKHEKY